jgi:hypothetical protein
MAGTRKQPGLSDNEILVVMADVGGRSARITRIVPSRCHKIDHGSQRRRELD